MERVRMPIYKGNEEEQAHETRKKEATASFRDFMGKEKTKRFVSDWNKKGYTKAGIEELLFEIYLRYGTGGDDDGDDDDKERKVLDRSGEMLDIMKSVRKLWEPFKKE